MNSFSVGDEVFWCGSKLAAPGPGRYYPQTHPMVPGRWWLVGTVIRVSKKDSQSIKVRWENGRTTIERAANLSHPIVMAA